MNGVPLEAEIERLAFGRDYREGAHADQSFARSGRPGAYRPPAIEPLHALEIRARHDDGLSSRGARDHVGKRNGHAATPKHALHFADGVRWKESAIFAHDHHVCTVAAEFFAELGLHVDVQIHHRGGDRRGYDHGEQCGSRAAPAHHGRAQQHA